MSRITLYALTGLVALVAVAGLASAEYYEGKPECPPDRMCTMSYGDEPEYSDANDTSPECEECMAPVDDPPKERGDGDGDASDDCFEDEEGNLVCYRNADGGDAPTMPQDCGGEVCAYGNDTVKDGPEQTDCWTDAEGAEVGLRPSRQVPSLRPTTDLDHSAAGLTAVVRL